MPTTPERPRSPGRAAAVITVTVALALVLSLLPGTAGSVAAADARAAAGKSAGSRTDWSAKQVRKGDIAPRDRELAARLPGGAKVGYHPETGRVRFISGSSSMPLSAELPGVAAGKRNLAAADARTAARRFVERYGPMFGLRDAARELRVKATERRLAPAAGLASVAAGRPNATVRFEQVREGVPVMGGEIAVQLSDDRRGALRCRRGAAVRGGHPVRCQDRSRRCSHGCRCLGGPRGRSSGLLGTHHIGGPGRVRPAHHG